MILHLKNAFTFIGGIGMFLYGMNIMSTGLQKVAGDKFSNLIKALTKNVFSSILVGALVTAVLHSSAATTVMVVGFVNASIMTLKQAVGVIMGANIGTTITAWIVSLAGLGSVIEVFKPEFFAPIVFGLSALIVTFAKRESTRSKANIFVGMGMLFIGLSFMAGGVHPYAESKFFRDSFEILGNYPILAVITGALVTAILSSSTASVSILQTLALAGSVSKGAACFITVGQNIGTCITTIISSAKGSKNGKRAALLHLIFNVLGGLIFSVFVFFTYPLIKNFLLTKITIFEISIFHTSFNILNTLILLPFSGVMVKLTERVIPLDSDEETDLNLSEKTKSILDTRLFAQPSVAINTVKNEIVYYAKYTLKNLKRATDLIVNVRNEELIEKVVSHEEQIDKTTYVLVDYLSKINKLNLTVSQSQMVEGLTAICNDIERIGDHAENISEKAKQMLDSDVKFTDTGNDEVKNIINLALTSVENGIICIDTKDKFAINKVREAEAQVDILEDVYRDNHLKRMSEGKCDTIPGMIFLDLVSNLERVTDHANNLADYAEK